MNEGIPIAHNESESPEHAFFREIATLPSEIAHKWLNEYEDMDESTSAFFDRFQSFLRMRHEALNKTVEMEDGLSDELRKEVNSVTDIIRNTFGDMNYFLGNGYTAEVYEFPIAPHLCVKYIHNQDAYNENNHLRVEYGFLEELRTFTHGGVRTPVPYFIRIHPSEGHSYGMERIIGKSLSQILEKPEENLELVLMVKNMNRKDVEDRLIGYVSAIYEQFHITHGDLFLRNIMLDESGEFRVIDFGKAKYEELGEDNERFAREDKGTLTSEIRTFFAKIDKLETV